MKARSAFRATFFAFVMSTAPAVISELIRLAAPPFRRTGKRASLRAKHTNDTRTAAPSTTHGSSDQASKIEPRSTIRSSTARLRPPRIEFVATRPARAIRPSATNAPALWNQ